MNDSCRRQVRAQLEVAVARAEFAGLSGGPDLLAAVSSWVGTKLSVPGSSGPTDGAVQTLLRRT